MALRADFPGMIWYRRGGCWSKSGGGGGGGDDELGDSVESGEAGVVVVEVLGDEKGGIREGEYCCGCCFRFDMAGGPAPPK